MFLSDVGAKQNFLHLVFLLSDRKRTFQSKWEKLARVHICVHAHKMKKYFAGKLAAQNALSLLPVEDSGTENLNIQTAAQNATKELPKNPK